MQWQFFEKNLNSGEAALIGLNWIRNLSKIVCSANKMSATTIDKSKSTLPLEAICSNVHVKALTDFVMIPQCMDIQSWKKTKLNDYKAPHIQVVCFNVAHHHVGKATELGGLNDIPFCLVLIFFFICFKPGQGNSVTWSHARVISPVIKLWKFFLIYEDLFCTDFFHLKETHRDVYKIKKVGFLNLCFSCVTGMLGITLSSSSFIICLLLEIYVDQWMLGLKFCFLWRSFQ